MASRFARIGMVVAVMGAATVSVSGEEPGPRRSAVVLESGDTLSISRSALERIARDSGARPRGVPAMQPSGSGPRQRRDSILNGALIGAAIGGVGGSAAVVAASGGSDDFRGAMVKVAPLTALAGFAIGAAIDALR